MSDETRVTVRLNGNDYEVSKTVYEAIVSHASHNAPTPYERVDPTTMTGEGKPIS